MGKKKNKKYCCDFETTVYRGQRSTEVWSAAITEIFGDDPEDVIVLHSIDEFFDHIFSNHKQARQFYYFHNLKFDGEFIIYWLMDNGYKTCFDEKKPDELKDHTFSAIISTMNQWYMISVKENGRLYQFRDSYKLLPFSVRSIGKSFKTKHQKTTLQYEGSRMPGYIPDDLELEYIKNDVLVMREAMEIMINEGYDGLTIGSCCMSNFKKLFYPGGHKAFSKDFPDLSQIVIDESFGSLTADEYIRKAYRGGWCYTRFPGYETSDDEEGITADVNSLYPSVMHSISGSVYPFGQPNFWKGNYIPKGLISDKGFNTEWYFYIRFECSFNIRPDHLPFVQIKDSIYYKSTDMLTTSQIFDKYGTPCRIYDCISGEYQQTKVTLTMTCTDFRLFIEHYKVENLKILDGCYFTAVKGIFDDYIDHYMQMKVEGSIEHDPVKRSIAKLSLNSLYGKFSTSINSSYKTCYINPETRTTEFFDVDEFDKTPGYIAIGAAVTSYARNFTIRAAQKNYKNFRYADTDSIHMILPKGDEVNGIRIHDTDLCAWKIENTWKYGRFVRAKTYIEYNPDINPPEDDTEYAKQASGEYVIKCAGLPQHCKNLFEACIRFDDLDDRKKWLNEQGESVDSLTDKELEFIDHKRFLDEFNTKLVIPGKLIPVHLPGGVLLKKVDFTIR